MKRVCMVRHAYYPEKPPTRRDAETLVANGYQVDVICLRNEGEKSFEVLNSVNVHRLPVQHHRAGALRYIFQYLAFFLLATLKLTGMSLRRRYQVVEVSAMPELLVFSALVPKLLGAKVVLNWLDRVVSLYVSRFKVSPDHITVRFLGLVEKASFIYADHIIVRQATSQTFMARRGIRASKVSIVLNVPGDDIFDPSALPPRKPDGNRFRLITHGSLLEQYGVQTLIRAVPLLTPHIPELDVQIVGDGEYRAELERLVQELGVGDRVQFTGLVPFEAIPGYISEADVGIVSMLIPLLPNKLFEYVALGRPAIVSSFPSVKLYFPEDTVAYFEPGNEHDLARCLLELYRDPERRASLVAAAQEVYQKYRWSAQKSEYLKVYERLASLPQPPERIGG